MNKLLTEEKVLKKLDIPDFRHLTKDKAIKLASMLDKMDPEVAKKALEQFPEFASASKEILVSYKEILDKALEDNAKGIELYYDLSNSIIESLKKELDKESLSSEDRRYIIDKMLEIHTQMGIKDSEDKKFRVLIIGIATVGVTILTGALLSAIGGNSSISLDE